MKFILAILSLLALTLADPDFNQWEAPRAGDVRSPCPALNAMANHKLIPHDGRNLTIPILVAGLGAGLNVSAETVTTLSKIGISLSADPAGGSFNLDDLSGHNKVEHDGSLSREDFDVSGDATSFCADVFNETLGFFGGAAEVGFPEVAAARWGRIQSSKEKNAKAVYGEKQYLPSYFESAAYFQLFRDPKSLLANVEWIKIFFREERMPFKEGWRPINVIDGFVIVENVLMLALNTPEKLPAINN